MRRPALIALLISALGVAGIAAVIATNKSVRDWIADTYTYVGTEPVPGDDDESLVYSSPDSASETAHDIAAANKPAEQRTTESGVFLRYRKDIVSVVPDGEGSRVIVDDEDSGYRRGYAYLGGWWGLYSGRGEAFRGGGPGSGK